MVSKLTAVNNALRKSTSKTGSSAHIESASVIKMFGESNNDISSVTRNSKGLVRESDSLRKHGVTKSIIDEHHRAAQSISSALAVQVSLQWSILVYNNLLQRNDSFMLCIY